MKLRVHRTHKEHHLAANPPSEEVVSYADVTGIRLIRVGQCERERVVDEAGVGRGEEVSTGRTQGRPGAGGP